MTERTLIWMQDPEGFYKHLEKVQADVQRTQIYDRDLREAYIKNGADPEANYTPSERFLAVE